MTAALAQAIVDGCRAHAAGKRQSHVIAVVDGGGSLVAALRKDVVYSASFAAIAACAALPASDPGASRAALA